MEVWERKAALCVREGMIHTLREMTRLEHRGEITEGVNARLGELQEIVNMLEECLVHVDPHGNIRLVS